MNQMNVVALKKHQRLVSLHIRMIFKPAYAYSGIAFLFIEV